MAVISDTILFCPERGKIGWGGGYVAQNLGVRELYVAPGDLALKVILGRAITLALSILAGKKGGRLLQWSSACGM